MAPLRILISNDDGVFADGIRTLAAAAAARGHQVTVVCPDQERSATGHGLTLQTPIRAERADELFAPGVTAWACSGTPADCMKLALFELVKEKPDLVLSGINHGPNLGTDVFCSGAVAAAMEGTLEGIRSLAVSSACFQWRQFQAAADLALEVSEQAIADQWIEFTTTTLLPPLIGCFFQTVRLLEADRSADALAKHLAALNAALDIVDARLATSKWLAGDTISIADIAAGSPMYRYFTMEIPRPERAALDGWYDRLTQRAAYRETVMTSYEELRGA